MNFSTINDNFIHNIELHKAWHSLVSSFTNDNNLINSMFNAIEIYYSQPHRFYHTLQHIKTMIAAARYYFDTSHQLVSDVAAFWFALWYHDIIYEPKITDNELQSALFAKKALKTLHIDNRIADRVYKLIIATKHTKPVSNKNENHATENLLLDCDLIILGSSRIVYNQYAQAVRKEYQFVPAPIYNKKRAAILTFFLQGDTIFNTSFFEDKFGKQAKENMKYELEGLMSRV